MCILTFLFCRIHARVVKRGPRSLGYGFVTFESEDHARLAQSQLNKQTLEDREINVELARESGDEERNGESSGRRGGFRGRGRGGFRGAYGYRGGRGGFRGGLRPRAPRTDGVPSETSLFVANLPFEMDDTSLASLFSQYKIVKAHIVTYRSSGRSKGYGFVEFESNQDQQKALLSMANAVVADRQLSIKVALNTQNEESAE